jgi:asparagine synthase (glutamine-hydrolysing)
VRYGHYWRVLPKYVRSPISRALGFLPRHESIKRALFSLDVPERIQRYQQVFSLMPAEHIDNLFRDEALPLHAADALLECWKDLDPLIEHTDELGGLQFLEIRSALPDELLMYTDKLSMAHGLEARVPYLDQEIVEYVERLPASFKVRLGTGKWLHRRLCKNFLPEKILKRKKLGFQTPIDEWFRESLTGKIDETLLDNHALMFQYLRPHAVQRLVKEHKNGRFNHSKILFSLVVLEEWLRHYLR